MILHEAISQTAPSIPSASPSILTQTKPIPKVGFKHESQGY